MYRLAILFVCLALVAAFFGYAGFAGYSWEGGRTLFFLFLLLALMQLAAAWWNRVTPAPGGPRS